MHSKKEREKEYKLHCIFRDFIFIVATPDPEITENPG